MIALPANTCLLSANVSTYLLMKAKLALNYQWLTLVLCARIGGFVATRFHPIKHCRSSIRAIL